MQHHDSLAPFILQKYVKKRLARYRSTYIDKDTATLDDQPET